MKFWHAKIAITIFLAFAALIGFSSYSFYRLLRVIVCAGASISAYRYHGENKAAPAWIFVIAALLFNPFIPVHLERELWFLLDMAVALVFIVSAYFDHTREG